MSWCGNVSAQVGSPLLHATSHLLHVAFVSGFIRAYVGRRLLWMGFGVVRMVNSSFVFVKMLASELAFIHTTGNRPPPPTFSCTRTVLHVPLTGTPTYARREWLGQPCRTPAPRDVLPVGPRSGTEPPCPVGEAQGSLADPYLGPTRTNALGCIFALHQPSITSHSTPPRAVRHAPRSTLHTLPLGTYGCARPLELPSQSTSRVHFCLSGGALGVLWISCRRPVTISRLTLPFPVRRDIGSPWLHAVETATSATFSPPSASSSPSFSSLRRRKCSQFFSGGGRGCPACQQGLGCISQVFCVSQCTVGPIVRVLSKNPVLTAVPAGGVWRTQEKNPRSELMPSSDPPNRPGVSREVQEYVSLEEDFRNFLPCLTTVASCEEQARCQ